MSQYIAPGKWDPMKRQYAKGLGIVIGAGLIGIGGWLGNVLIVRTLEAGRDVTMWSVMIPLVPIVLGGVAVFPNVVLPLAYRIIDRVGKDAPG